MARTSQKVRANADRVEKNVEVLLNFTQEEIDMLAKKHEQVKQKKEEKVNIKKDVVEEDSKLFTKKNYREISHHKRKL